MCPIPWLYVSCRGYAWLYMVIYYTCTEKESEPRNDSQGRPPFIMTAATSRKYSTRWFYVVIHPIRGYTFESMLIPIVLLQMCNHLTRITQEWLCVHDRGYTSHIVVMRGYTWLYTVYVPKRCHNLQTMVLYGYTIKAVVTRPSSWLYEFCSPYASAAYQNNPGVVMSPRSWLYVSYHGYLWLYMFIYYICTKKMP